MSPSLEVIKTLGLSLIGGAVGAFLTNYFGAHFTFNRFRKEQWWLAKRDAYDSIIRRLADLKFACARELASLETGGVMVPPKAPEREKALAWSLQEVSSAGRYIVSAETAEAVQQVLKVLAGAEPDFYQELCNEYDAADEALKIVRAEAHRDLKVEKKGGS